MKIPRSGVRRADDGLARCWWCHGDALYMSYHDAEWGRPIGDDTLLFEKLCLEGFMAGLSWLTILRKRENFRKAFKGFDMASVARFNQRSVERLLSDPGIVRHRGKIESTINNARRCLELTDEFGNLSSYAWSFEPDDRARPKRLNGTNVGKFSSSTESIAMSKDLKRRGWTFVGPTTVHSFMEATGMVNDHMTACDFRDEVEREQQRFRRTNLHALLAGLSATQPLR